MAVCFSLQHRNPFSLAGPFLPGNLQQILNMLLVQQLPPSLPDSMEPGVKAIVANALQHEVGVRAEYYKNTIFFSYEPTPLVGLR